MPASTTYLCVLELVLDMVDTKVMGSDILTFFLLLPLVVSGQRSGDRWWFIEVGMEGEGDRDVPVKILVFPWCLNLVILFGLVKILSFF